MPEKQDALEQLRYLQEVYAREYQTLLNEISNYLLVSNSFERNREILNNADKFKNSSILLNIEAGTFVKVNANDFKSVLVQVGAGYLVEKNVEEAKEFVGKNSERLQANLKQLGVQKQKVEKELLDLSYKIEGMQQA